jgi:hypothetical protein
MRNRIRSPALLLAALLLVAALGAVVAFAENIDPCGYPRRRSGSLDPDTPHREGLAPEAHPPPAENTPAYGKGRGRP